MNKRRPLLSLLVVIVLSSIATAWGETESPATDELQIQFMSLQRDIQDRGHFDRVGAQAYHPQANILNSDRDPVDVVLRRTAALLADLKQMPSAPDLTAMAKQFDELQTAATKIEAKDVAARTALFKKICGIRREIAFANPLLNFDELLFLKRHRATYNHMCDQYYGVNAVPGGGLYVLADPFGAEPKVRDITAEAVVQSGRLKGSTLAGGSFLSPDLSFDGKRVAFAYVECEGDPKLIVITPTPAKATGTRAAAITCSR